jgi:hypothetical protein
MPKATRQQAPLTEYYDSEDKGSVWHLWCKVCKRGWQLTKPAGEAEVKPGNLLHLLNHAYSHKPEAKRA